MEACTLSQDVPVPSLTATLLFKLMPGVPEALCARGGTEPKQLRRPMLDAGTPVDCFLNSDRVLTIATSTP